jgi:hypothetical protein
MRCPKPDAFRKSHPIVGRYLNAATEGMPDGSSRPHPKRELESLDLDPQGAGQHFVRVQAIFVDDRDGLWILDPAAPMLTSIVPCGPKLVRIDLRTNRVTRTIGFSPEIVRTHTYLNDAR